MSNINVLEVKFWLFIELWSVYVVFGCVLVVIVVFWVFMMFWQFGWIMGLIVGGFGVMCVCQVFEVLCYQYGLKYCKIIWIVLYKILVVKEDYYFGEGFVWG